MASTESIRQNGKCKGIACSFPGCGRECLAKGLCAAHYQQQKRNPGNPLEPLPYRQRNTPPRILFDEVPCVVPGLAGPCHVFRGAKNSDGYGNVKLNGKIVSVHRYVLEQANGPIQDGLEVDHQCRNRACCNLSHLRLVTHKVNSTENIVNTGWQVCAAKTHCPQGHEYTAENTYSYKGVRICRTCNRDRNREFVRKKRSSTKKSN